MNDPRIDKLAELIINYCIGVKPGYKVLLHGHVAAQSLMLAMQKQTLQLSQAIISMHVKQKK